MQSGLKRQLAFSTSSDIIRDYFGREFRTGIDTEGLFLDFIKKALSRAGHPQIIILKQTKNNLPTGLACHNT
jgi:hypothetical protein